MFNERDLFVIGLGLGAAVIWLFVPISFGGKIAAAALTFVCFLVIAFLRLGRDSLTIEVWLKRRVRFWVQPRYWTFQIRDLPAIKKEKKMRDAYSPPKRDSHSASFRHREKLHGGLPIRLTHKPGKSHALVKYFLRAVGLSFIWWLGAGGAIEIGLFWREVLP